MATEIGPLAVRRSVWIDATPERVWREFDSFERMAAWFGLGHRLLVYEPELGGRMELAVTTDAAEELHFGGRIVVFEPGRELTFEDDWMPSQGWRQPTLLTLRLTPALNGTLVELFHHAFERLGPDAGEQHRGYEGGWGMTQLDALQRVVHAG